MTQRNLLSTSLSARVFGDLSACHLPTKIIDSNELVELKKAAAEHKRDRSTNTDYLPDRLASAFKQAVNNLIEHVGTCNGEYFTEDMLMDSLSESVPVAVRSTMSNLRDLGALIYPYVSRLRDFSDDLGPECKDQKDFIDNEAIAVNYMADGFLSNLDKVPAGIALFTAIVPGFNAISDADYAVLQDQTGVGQEGLRFLPLESIEPEELGAVYWRAAFLQKSLGAIVHKAEQSLVRSIGADKIAEAFAAAFGIENVDARFRDTWRFGVSDDPSFVELSYPYTDDETLNNEDHRAKFLEQLRSLIPENAGVIISGMDLNTINEQAYLGLSFQPVAREV